MAKTNKYTSLNFNDIYEKKKIINNSPNSTSSLSSRSPSSSLSSSTANPNKSYSLSASSHGGMLVLSRPSPKPHPLPPPLTTPSSAKPTPPDSDSISLRPLGKTGSGSPVFQIVERDNKETLGVVPKSDKFVPPHLRPGFVAREQKPVPELQRPGGVRAGGFRPGSGHGHYGSPNRYGDDGRPKSGGYERRFRGVGAGDRGVGGGELDLVNFNRPRSRETRPNSSGW